MSDFKAVHQNRFRLGAWGARWVWGGVTSNNCARLLMIFTARRYAYARSLLSSGVCPAVHHVRVLYPDG